MNRKSVKKITFDFCDRLSQINNKSTAQITLFKKWKRNWSFKWVSETLKYVENVSNNHRIGKIIGDYDQGMVMYYNLGCTGCRGSGGKSAIPSPPTLEGKDVGWIVQQLKDFRSYARKDATMNAMASGCRS